MANMPHCRFKNTYNDLCDCSDALDNAGSVQDAINEANKYEKDYIEKIIRLCAKIADQYSMEAAEIRAAKIIKNRQP